MKNTNKIQLAFIIPNEKQKKLWDKLVSESPEGNIYSLSWYLDCVSNNSWGLITDEKITTGLPIAFKKRTGYKNVYQPFYTMFFDVLNPIGEIGEYLAVIQNDFHKIHITTQSKNKILKSKPRIRQEMKLTAEFAKNYSENASRQIKKAIKSNLNCEIHDDTKEVVTIFKNNKGAELKEYKAADFKKLGELIDVCLKNNNGFCANVKYNGELLASGFFITYKNSIIFLKGGMSDSGKKVGAMYYLMHKIIESVVATESGLMKSDFPLSRLTSHPLPILLFDFGGSNNKNVAEFYRKLGGIDTSYCEIEVDKRNVFQKIVRKLLK